MQNHTGNKIHTSYYIPVRVAANDGRKHLHECHNCGHAIDTYGMRDIKDYHTCPGCGCKMLEAVNYVFRKYGFAKGDSITESIAAAVDIMLANEESMNACREISAGMATAYYGSVIGEPDKKGFTFNRQKETES